jgi:hypothetical protein
MKKVKPPERKAGIWLDQENAYIVQIIGEDEPVIEKIKSNVESRIRIPGEVKVSARFGNLFADDKEKKQHRQQNQREKFFKKVIDLVHDDDYLYLFGPGKAKEGLNNAIEKSHSIKGEVVAIETTDKLTQKETLTKTKEYYNNDTFRMFKKNLRKKLKAMS